MSKLSSFVRKYGEEIGIVGNIISTVILRLIPNRQDRDSVADAAERLIEASRSIAASYRDIEKAIPSPQEIFDNAKPVIAQIVADLVEAELSRRLGVNPATEAAVRAGALDELISMGHENTPAPGEHFTPPADGIPDPTDAPAQSTK